MKEYTCVKCKRCGKDYALKTEDLLSHKGYIVCTYCSSRDIKVKGAYDDLKECMSKVRHVDERRL